MKDTSSALKNQPKKARHNSKNFNLYITELCFTFLFRDILYVLLPLIVVLFTYYVFGNLSLIDFLSSSNVAFAVTVLTLSSFLELKARHRNPNSLSIFEASKIYILLIVLSALLLSFIILTEIGALDFVITKGKICIYNVSLFTISAAVIFIRNSISLKGKYGIAEKINAYKLINMSMDTLDYSNINLEKLLYVIDKSDNNELSVFPESPIQMEMEICKKHEVENIKSLIRQNKEKLNLIEESITKIYG